MQIDRKRSQTGWLLTGLYCACVLVRFLLALFTSAYPTVRIDEYLYASLARSIATEGSLLYLGQPAVYNYIVYPLILSPVYALFPAGTDYYRLIQGWNILIMSLSVFPMYALCRALYGERKKALWVTALCMLLPDFILGQGIFSEAVIYPLFYTLMYCVYGNLLSPRPRYAVRIGLLGGLLYAIKPGAVVPAVVALLLSAGRAVRKKSGREGLSALSGGLCLGAVILFFLLIAKYRLGYEGSFFSIYDSQLRYGADAGWDDFSRTLFLYPYYFLLGCGVLPLVYSLRRLSLFREGDRRFLLLTLLSALAIMVGTAWTVNRPERTRILFLRYADMYLPLVFAFSILPAGEERPVLAAGKRAPVGGPCLFLLAYAAVCTVFAGASAGIGGPLDVHFLFSLAVLFLKDSEIISGAAVLFLCVSSLYLLWKNAPPAWMRRVCCFLFLGVALLSNYVGYAVTASNAFPRLGDDARQVHRMLEGRDYLYVYASSRCDYGLDVNSRGNAAQVTIKDFAKNLRENRGVYTPFVPASSRGMTARRETPDLDALVLNWKTGLLIQFSAAVSSSPSPEGTYQVIRFEKGGRIADGVLTGTEETTLKAGKAAELLLLNDDWLGRPVTLVLEIESEKAQDLALPGASPSSVRLNEGSTRCEFLLNEAKESYRLEVPEEDAALVSFALLPPPSETD